MRLEAGKTYLSTAGEKIGPVIPWDSCASDHTWQWTVGDGAPDEDQIYREDGTSRYNSDLIAEWTEGPVRTVTRREVIEGRYACVDVGHVIDVPECENPDASPTRKVAVALYGYRSATELKAAAAVLLELAGALE